MKGNIEERAVELAQYIVENRATVRSAAAKCAVPTLFAMIAEIEQRLAWLACIGSTNQTRCRLRVWALHIETAAL